MRTECSGGDKLTHTMATMVPRPSSARRSQREGLLFSLTAAAGFSTTGIFAKLAYAAHVHVATLLSLRFLVASALLWLVIAGTRQPLPSKRTLLLGLLLGLVGYGLQVTLLFLSLKRIDAALSSLLFYSYPAMVTVGAVLLGRERMTRRRGIALAVAMAGVLLVFSTAASSRRDTTGVLLSVASALVYAALILIADRLGREVGPLVLSTLVPTGAAVTFVLGGLLLGDLRLDVTLPGWEAMLGLALVASVVWTGLKDGPDGFWGKPVWIGARAFCFLLVISYAVRFPRRTRSLTFRAGGHGFCVIVLAEVEGLSPEEVVALAGEALSSKVKENPRQRFHDQRIIWT